MIASYYNSKKEFCGGIILGSNGKSKVITRPDDKMCTDVDADGGVSERVKGRERGFAERASERVVLCCVSRLVMCARGKHKQSDVAARQATNGTEGLSRKDC